MKYTSEWLRTNGGNYCQVEFYWDAAGKAICQVHHKRGCRSHPSTQIVRCLDMNKAVDAARMKAKKWFRYEDLYRYEMSWRYGAYRLEQPVRLVSR